MVNVPLLVGEAKLKGCRPDRDDTVAVPLVLPVGARTEKLLPLAPVKPLMAWYLMSPPSVRLPVTLIWSYCVPAVVPPRSTSTDEVPPSTRLPLTLSVPAVPAVPGRMKPLLVSVLALTLIRPLPVSTPPVALVNPPGRLNSVPLARLMVPDWVKVPPATFSALALTLSTPVAPLVNDSTSMCEVAAVLATVLVRLPLLINVVPALASRKATIQTGLVPE